MTFGELTEIYELTYKYQMLREQYRRDGGWLRDVANVAWLKIKSRLFGLIDKGLEEMNEVFKSWLEDHENMAVEAQMDIIRGEIQSAESAVYGIGNPKAYRRALDDIDEMLKNNGLDPLTDEERTGILRKVNERIRAGDIEGAYRWFSDSLWDDIYTSIDDYDIAEIATKLDREFNAIREHQFEIEEAWYGRTLGYPTPRKQDLDDMLMQFHIGLHISHHNGVMAELLLENVPAYMGSVNEFLKALSSGIFVDKWDRDLARLIGNRYDPVEEDSQFIDWSERGRIRNPEAIPAPEFHIFIRE